MANDVHKTRIYISRPLMRYRDHLFAAEARESNNIVVIIIVYSCATLSCVLCGKKWTSTPDKSYEAAYTICMDFPSSSEGVFSSNSSARLYVCLRRNRRATYAPPAPFAGLKKFNRMQKPKAYTRLSLALTQYKQSLIWKCIFYCFACPFCRCCRYLYLWLFFLLSF